MKLTHTLPADIERTSMRIIGEELSRLGRPIPKENEAVVKRVIHATADFDFADSLHFSRNAVSLCMECLRRGVDIITDSNMALAGVSKPAAARLGCTAHCFMAEDAIAQRAKEMCVTRAAAAMDYAAGKYPGAAHIVGNAPTALFILAEKMENGYEPAFVVASPVGFVNVIEAKEKIVFTCEKYGVPVIAPMGRKGGSTVAAAILNALLYGAADMLDPAARGWR